MEFRGLIPREGTVLVVIDVQEKLFPFIVEKDTVSKNLQKLVKFAQIMDMPIVLTEQYPKGLGRTIPEIRRLIPNINAIEKVEFNCFGSEEFRNTLRRLGAKTIILAGIETHICVSQTAIDGLGRYRVGVISDAVSSRSLEDKRIGLERMNQSGVTILSTEMFIYEILKKAGTEEFKEALKLIK